ncbi:Inter-alpha-trypsin inhibitor heavy chain H4 [Anas platyrhynchos]|uniref:Inter-alpha-trypsin inhibitor heavy chain H4 n=1 Tax=Anas platyrhynchos TaxID=8839 RepID=R0KVB7_ANAPL|nr:Inter-alpha-trypsin inhibitor heavy chain H4 [Anas platyrhynchos]
MEERTLLALMVFSSLVVLTETITQKHAIEIYSLRVNCRVTSRFAHTVITSKIINRANESREATFEVELPKTAFITNFSMSIDGKLYPGIIKEKASAQKEYDTAVSQGQSAGLVKITGRKLEQFHVSVSIAAASKVTFELAYEELLKRQLGLFEVLIKVRPQQLVKHFQIDVHIFEPQGIRFLETDSTFMTNELNEALTKVQNETKAHILFKPTVDQQKVNPELDETLLNGDFLVRYDVKQVATAGESKVEVIQENIQKAVNGKYALFCLGFGFDVSYNFLEKMALSNGGIARRIYENSDAALQLQGFYQEVATPILMKIEMQYPDNAVEGLTKNNFKLFFEGSEIVVSGKISNELDLLPVEIKAQSHTSDLTLKEEANVKEKEQVFQSRSYIFGNFIERLWAYLTIQQLLEKSISAQEEQQKALEARALELSLQYGFVTPLTSMVVTKPTGQQQAELANKPTEADNEKPSSFPVGAKEHPALVSQLPKENTDGQAEPSVLLLSDPEQGLSVTGKHGDKINQFVQFEITYVNPAVQINVSVDEIVLSHDNKNIRLSWTESATSAVQG